MIPIDETLTFFNCYRRLIDSCRLTPETEAAQLAAILRRVRNAPATAPPPGDGRRGAPAIQAGGTSP